MTLVIVRTHFDKEFAFFIPHNLEETCNFKKTSEILSFYWINNDELITCTSSNSGFDSTNDTLIGIFGAMTIWNDRRR